MSLYLVPVTLPHVLTLPSAKSESVDVVELDARVSARKVEKQGRFAPKTSGSLRSMPPSRKEPIAGNMSAVPDFGVYDQGDGTSVWFTIAHNASVAWVAQSPPVAVKRSRPLPFH